MKVYLAGVDSRSFIVKLYLAGHHLWNYINAPSEGSIFGKSVPKINVLQTFYRRDRIITESIAKFNSFMLDSGAFSFIQSGKHPNLENYIARYIKYINDNDVKLFFELDIDKLIGYDRVKEIRRRLEVETGKRPIPVWHKRLGKEEFLRMCDEYDYVAIGGIVSKEIMPRQYKYLPAFIREAHKRGTKIHGLGFANSKWLPICHFDSVDSSTWTTGNRFGYVHIFDGDRIRKIKKPDGYRIKNVETAINNFVEWLKFANYAEGHL